MHVIISQGRYFLRKARSTASQRTCNTVNSRICRQAMVTSIGYLRSLYGEIRELIPGEPMMTLDWIGDIRLKMSL
jgi:hypothetical protein